MAAQVIDWLRRGNEAPAVTVGGRELPLAIRRHPRATRLTMRLAPDGSEVRVTLPRWGRTSDALVFASKRIDWLESQLAAVPRAHEGHDPVEVGGKLAGRRGAVHAVAARHHADHRAIGDELARDQQQPALFHARADVLLRRVLAPHGVVAVHIRVAQGAALRARRAGQQG